jgi:plastocyanin
MKYLFTLIALLAIAETANATVHTITCQNFPSHFLPMTVNAMPGDTIHWTWVVGNHPVGPQDPTYIPAGAPMFYGVVDANHHDYETVVTVPGSYFYDCHPNSPHGEEGTIIVGGALAATPNHHHETKDRMSVYPNLGDGHLNLTIDCSLMSENNTLIVYNQNGQEVLETKVTGMVSQLDLSKKAKGIYFIRFYSPFAILTKELIIQ